MPAALEILRHPRAAASYLQVLRSTPQQDVQLQGNCGPHFRVGLETARRLVRGVTQPVAALIVPEHDEIYLRGHRKQALRTNIHRALDAGSVAQPATEPDKLAVINELVARRHHDDNWGEPPQLVLVDELVVIAGWDAAERPLVAAAAWTCSRWALLSFFVRVTDAASASACRHLTQLEMVRELRRRGIHWFVAGPALSVPAELRYLHHLWGFDPMRLRLEHASRLS